MDYIRIYEAFIKDRRAKEPTLTGYTERHHILPRSLGGGDEPENLIALTPEDHFFAHLILAKIHRGKMASALACMMMITANHWGRRLASRGRYGLAKRIAASGQSEAWTGDKNPLFNATKYEWVNHRTGEERTATLYAMHKEYGASRGTWTSVASGRKPSCIGWTLKEREGSFRKLNQKEKFWFINRDGRKFCGTQIEFQRHAGTTSATSWRIVHQRSVTRCGWRLAGVMDRSFNAPRDGTNTGPKPSFFTLVNGQASIRGTRSEIATALGSTVQQVSASIYALRMGKVASYKGWRLVKEEGADTRAA